MNGIGPASAPLAVFLYLVARLGPGTGLLAGLATVAALLVLGLFTTDGA